MKKRIFILVLVICIICSTFVLAQENILFDVIPYDYKLFWNGENLNFDSHVLLVNGQTYVPLRDMAEEMMMNVEWNGETQEIRISEKYFDIWEIFYDKYKFNLPETAEILNYAYERFGRDVHLKAKIFFEESDLEYIKQNLDKITSPLSPDEMNSENITIANLSKEYDWWDISTLKEAQYAYFGFMEGVEVMSLDVWGLISKDNNSGGYYLYIA